MARLYREFNFDDDVELMNLTYKMNTGNSMNYENDDIIEDNKNEVNTQLPKFEL